MIKTFIDEDFEKLDEKVNTFMKKIKQNCPVRDSVFVIGGKVIHKALVFYKTNLEEEENKYTDKRVGAGWNNPDGTINILIDKKQRIENINLNTLQKIGKKHILKFGNRELKIVPKLEKYKKGSNPPDFVVYE